MVLKNQPSRMDRFDKHGKTVLNADFTTVKKHHFRKYILGGLIGVTIGVTVFASAITHNVKHTIDKTYSAANVIKSRNVNQVLKDHKPFSILLMGTDTGELNRDDKGRTDSIMVVTINPNTESISLVSLPRDATVAIDGFENTFPQKLNSAYTFGSAATSIKEVQDYLNIPIDFYALVNMGGLEKLINQVNGIQVKSPLDFTYSQDTAHDYGPHLYRFTKGSSTYQYSESGNESDFVTKTSMNGDAALAFSRMRYDDPLGDYGRQLRQRLVLETLIKKSGNVSTILNTKFMSSVSANVKTDLTFDDLLTIGRNYINTRKNINSDHLQGQDVMYNGVSYEVVPQSEKQRVTNEIRKNLDLDAAKTGRTFGGDIDKSTIDPAFTNAAEDGLSSDASQ